jgi:hypothetical protein
VESRIWWGALGYFVSHLLSCQPQLPSQESPHLSGAPGFSHVLFLLYLFLFPFQARRPLSTQDTGRPGAGGP